MRAARVYWTCAQAHRWRGSADAKRCPRCGAAEIRPDAPKTRGGMRERPIRWQSVDQRETHGPPAALGCPPTLVGHPVWRADQMDVPFAPAGQSGTQLDATMPLNQPETGLGRSARALWTGGVPDTTNALAGTPYREYPPDVPDGAAALSLRAYDARVSAAEFQVIIAAIRLARRAEGRVAPGELVAELAAAVTKLDAAFGM